MQDKLPISIKADSQFPNSITPLLNKLEMWINFQALKADWYSNEDYILSFDFTILRNLQRKALSIDTINWIVERDYAYQYDRKLLKTTAFIEVDDIVKNGVGIEKAIKARLTKVANHIALQHGLLPLSQDK